MRHPFLRTLAGSGVTTDPNFENVTLLLHGDGTNGGQNNTFVDGSTNNFTITRNGNTTQGTFSPYGDNWSNYFDGTGDYLQLTGGDGFNLTGDFTVEAWIYRTTTGSQRIVGKWNNAGNLAWVLETSTTAIGFGVANSGTFSASLSFSATINLFAWNHVAVSRSGSTVRAFLNGADLGSATSSANCTANNTNPIQIGQTENVNYVNGYISNVRVVKGTAVYTAAFTVPTAPLTAITNTSLLTCQSNRFRDNSTNNFTITRNGDVSVQRFSPFSPTAAYAAGMIGGSGYFDGTGDNLLISSATGLCDFAAGQAFTFQLWFYRLGSTEMVFIGGGTGTFQMGVISGASGGVRYSKPNFADVFFGAGSVPIGTWTHITLCRNTSNTTRCWINGVSVASTTSDTNAYSLAATYIGSQPAGTSPTNGYLSDMRILKGQALYDPTSAANIAVPTAPLTAVANTSFLLNFTNASIRDNAMMTVLETVGDSQIDTAIKKYGTGSMEFDAIGDRLVTPSSPDNAFGTGNFTIEFWVYRTGGGQRAFISTRTTSTTGWSVSTDGSNRVLFNYDSSSFSTSSTLANNTWYHIAVVREGTGTNQTKIYINGTSSATGTVASDFTPSGIAIAVNRSSTDASAGYFDDIRLTKGVARYTANFTPPTAAFPDL